MTRVNIYLWLYRNVTRRMFAAAAWLRAAADRIEAQQ